jgi:hypothetical protein
MRHRTPYLGRRLILSQSLIDHLPQQIVVGPGEIFDLGDELGPHPLVGSPRGGAGDPPQQACEWGDRLRAIVGAPEAASATRPPAAVSESDGTARAGSFSLSAARAAV